jgi:TldD protein
MAEKNEKQEKNELPQDEYWALTSDFTQIVNRAREGYQEKSPGREIDFVNLFMGSRSGIICKTDERGIPNVIVSGEEVDNQGQKRTQRFFIGLQSGAATKDEAFLASNLAERETIVKEFEVSSHGHELVRSAVKEAQKAGEKIQRRIDEENYEWFPLFHVKGEERSINEDYEPKIDLDLVVNLVAGARHVIRQELGAKVKNVETVFLKWTENMEYADTDGAKIDHIIPRVAFSISVKTKDDSEAFGSIRGSIGTISQILRRYDEDEQDRDLLEIVQELAREVSKEAIDLDRAQGASILGTECPVIFSSQAAGVLAHEIFGHPSESDIICHNRRSKIAKLTLKSRIGAQVSDHSAFSIIDTGQATTVLGSKPKDEVVPELAKDQRSKQIKNAFGSLIVDEEGCPAKETRLVDRGIQINVLNDRYTFNEIIDGLKEEIVEGMKKHGLTGNVRREKYDLPPQVRMTNTYILPDENGPSSKEEMAAQIPKTKKGVYIKSCSGGWVDINEGIFMINGNLCYLIENGTITDKPIKGVRITGNIAKFTDSIKAVGSSKTIERTFTGYCGKNNQWVPVEGGGPLLYIEDAKLGGISRIPWSELVAEYDKQHREVLDGMRTEDGIYFPEIAEIRGKETPQTQVCLVTAVMLVEDEVSLIMGKRDHSHFTVDNGNLIRRGDKYE